MDIAKMRTRKNQLTYRSTRRKLLLQALAATILSAGPTSALAEDNIMSFANPNSIERVSAQELPGESFREILASHVMAMQSPLTDPPSSEDFDLEAPPVPKALTPIESQAAESDEGEPDEETMPRPVPTPIPDETTDSANGPIVPVPAPIPEPDFDQIPSSSDIGGILEGPIDSQGQPMETYVPSDEPASRSYEAMPEPLPLNDDVQSVVDPELAPSLLTAPIPNTSEFLPHSDLSQNIQRTFSTTRPALGAVAGAYSSAPAMLGDHFGGTFTSHGGGMHQGHTISLAGGDRRFKVAENVSPKPQDRVFFNYNHFHNALRDVNDENQHLDRFTLGFEKTFFDGNSSFEWRLPFASGLNSAQTLGSNDTLNTELGNLGLAFKTVLKSGCNWMLTGGASVTLPTGDDFELYNPALDLVVRNDAVHVAPFLGYLRNPGGKWFFQSFIQADFDLNGNDVLSTSGFEGVLQDQNLLFVDASLGKWLFRSCDPCDRVSGVAFITELHYTTTLNDTDDVAGLRNAFNRIDVLNATGGLNIQLGQTALRVGASAPLRQDEERIFDSEIIFQMNRYF